MSFITRFAPSPTGPLHLGHAFSALRALDAARAGDGRFLLRIEDLDQAAAGRSSRRRSSRIYLARPCVGDAHPATIRAPGRLCSNAEPAVERGLCYRCFRTRRELLGLARQRPARAPADLFRRASGAAEEQARLVRSEPFAWRLSIARRARRSVAKINELSFADETGLVKVDPGRLGDVVIARKDFSASYHLASVWDDALQRVTQVIRGEDLRDAAHLHTCCAPCSPAAG